MNANQDEISQEKLEKACGIGIEITDEDI